MNELQRQIIQSREIRFSIARDTRKVLPEVVEVPDNRYRILITLIRSDRPRYWHFLCFNCGSKIVELQNLEVYMVDDFYDPENINNSAVGKHCAGRERKCPYSYFFHVQ